MKKLFSYWVKFINFLRSSYIEQKVDTGLMPIWFKIAEAEIGVKEIRGGEHPRIIEYHMSTSLKSKEDEIPWCSSFVCWCLEQNGIKSTRSAWARSYLKWGIKLDKPKPGCIVVFQRGNAGHVAFFVSDDETGTLVLGGNQSDSVCFSEYNKKDVLGYRWPDLSPV